MKLSSLFALVQLCAAALAADTASWKARNIYFALTDRIARSGSDSGGGSCGDLGNYCGGTFQGLQSKLDYIKGLGFDAIWITPVVANSDGGYHGYWARDLYTVNPKYGSADDLKSLVNAAHGKGMYVMVDVVANHMGKANLADNKPTPLDQASSYHPDCVIDYSNQTSIENCRIGGLPDVDTQDPAIRKLYQSWVRWLISEFGFDGVRIDTVRHVEKDFWPDFASAAGVYTIGEVFDGNPDFLAGYAGLMSGLLNYAIYYPLNNFYQQKGSSQALVEMHDTVSRKFPDPAALGTFVDNHDNPRWLNQKNDPVLLRNALTYVLLARGVPILYYGTEQGFAGGADPANREDLWRSGFPTDGDMYKFVATVAGVRKNAGGLPENDHVHLFVADTAYAWSRAGGKIVVLTSNGGKSQHYCFNTQRQNGSWKGALDGKTYTSDGSGQLCADVVNGEPVVLVSA
ncbi:Alpha-amylase [Purpureocillium takamizusanense]|uniref:Alpha-amylase n=1 Tax=Purpureocillium takamizusanense TaxID=2060973 RepID=A0A9Q8QP48_9HYPO|nr:Alpha-amylase [Purpureocillium takamizusanense]UNI22321.1 Alpha-amylase [Purpureocillium takamizusanense]